MKKLWLCVLALGLAGGLGGTPQAAAQDAAAGNKEPIKIELPEANLSGTPFEYESPNLEPYDFRDRAPFLAPKGTELVSKGKKVTASAKPNYGELAMLVDGDKGYTKSSLIELPEGTQWIQVDLGAEYNIYAVLLWHYHMDKRVYFHLGVQVSEDPDFKTGVTTLYNNDYDNSNGLGVGRDKEYIEDYKGRLMDAKGVKGRYVRCHSNGNSYNEFNNYVELEVFGKPTK